MWQFTKILAMLSTYLQITVATYTPVVSYLQKILQISWIIIQI